MATKPEWIIRPTRSKKPAKVLREAKELLEADNGVKWCKNEMIAGRTVPSVCAMGAVTSVVYGIVQDTDDKGKPVMFFGPRYPSGYDDDSYHYTTFLHAAVQEVDPGNSVPSFNDDPKTRKRDVLRLFDKAIEIAESEESK